MVVLSHCSLNSACVLSLSDSLLCMYVQSSCDLLRKIIRMLYLLKRLKALMQSGTREITKVAQTFSEIGVGMFVCVFVCVCVCVCERESVCVYAGVV